MHATLISLRIDLPAIIIYLPIKHSFQSLFRIIVEARRPSKEHSHLSISSLVAIYFFVVFFLIQNIWLSCDKKRIDLQAKF